MNYSLVYAGSRTHCKIVAMAFVASVLIGLAAHALVANTSFQPQLGQSIAQIAPPTVCRFSGS